MARKVSFSASWQAVRGWVPAQRPQGWMRMMLAGVMLFICGETLWLFEEFFNGFNGFVQRRHPSTSFNPAAWVYGSAAIAAFPISGLLVNSDTPTAVHALVAVWTGFSFAITVIHSMTTLLGLLGVVCMTLGADPPYNPGMVPLFAGLAITSYRFCRQLRHCARTLHTAPAQLLASTWRLGRQTGVMIAVISCAHIAFRQLLDRSYAKPMPSWAIALPLAPLLYAIVTTSERRESLLRYIATLEPRADTDLDTQFDIWLHLKLSRFDVTVLSVLALYWALQSWLSLYHPIEMMITICLSVLLIFRWNWLRPSEYVPRDGEAWCVCLILWQAAEAGAVALGSADWVFPLVTPRLAYRELAFAINLLIGLMHGTQPIHERARRWTVALIEVLHLLWLAPTLRQWHVPPAASADQGEGEPSYAVYRAGGGGEPSYSIYEQHPCRLLNGELNQAYLILVGGCCFSFTLGIGAVQLFVHSTLKPVWTSEKDHQRLAADKARRFAEDGPLIAPLIAPPIAPLMTTDDR